MSHDQVSACQDIVTRFYSEHIDKLSADEGRDLAKLLADVSVRFRDANGLYASGSPALAVRKISGARRLIEDAKGLASELFLPLDALTILSTRLNAIIRGNDREFPFGFNT